MDAEAAYYKWRQQEATRVGLHPTEILTPRAQCGSRAVPQMASYSVGGSIESAPALVCPIHLGHIVEWIEVVE